MYIKAPYGKKYVTVSLIVVISANVGICLFLTWDKINFSNFLNYIVPAYIFYNTFLYQRKQWLDRQINTYSNNHKI